MKILTIAFLFTILVGVTFSNPEMPNVISDHLCSPCKSLFDEVKKNIITVNLDNITQYEKNANKTCDGMFSRIQSLDNECKNVFANAFEGVAKSLNELKEAINPETICKNLHMC